MYTYLNSTNVNFAIPKIKKTKNYSRVMSLSSGGRPATGGRVRRARTRAGDSRRSRAGRGRLAEQHGVPRRLPRRSSRHYLVLAGHWQVHERAASAAGAVRDGNIVDTVRGILGAARLDGPAALLHRALGPRGVAATCSHLLQPPRPAALPHAAPTPRETTACSRRDQHLRHRVNSSAARL